MSMKIRVQVSWGKVWYHNDLSEVEKRYTADEIRESDIGIVYNGVIVGQIDSEHLAHEMSL